MSCLERIEKAFERIEQGGLNTYITLNREGAVERAREIDRSKSEEGRLSGVPIAIKDAITTKGIRTTCASRMLEDYIPPYDAHVIECLLREGAIIIGKTNMDEFSMGTSTETSYFGPTLNPHDRTRVPGGSSGGSAATVAAGEVRLALGSDTGGSIRCPASFCGVVGLKPTYGLVSRYGLIAYANSLEQIGPIGRTVPDVALLLDVISSPDPRDSTQIGSAGGYLDNLTPALEGMRIAVPCEFFGDGIDPAVERAVWDMIHRAEELGATYSEVSIPSVEYALAAYYIIAMSEASSNLARFDGLRYGLRLEDEGNWHATFSKIRAEGFGEEVKRRILLGTYALSAGYYGRYYLKALKMRRMIKEEFDRILSDFDLIFTPTMPFTAFKLGEKINDPLSLYLADVNTVPVNLAGLPSISIPAGYSGGLPIGLQIIGGYFEEQKILNASYALFEDGEDERGFS
ncbi:MAG TPA: Asp-tRNA(Asn)/Glu-tRNA(Gln) amidotransferase subunit GatA [Candidatus Syntrophoarchaeum butanivorans]|uniref:Glutamyl-tRNA(Gln) amidotransferase subunit A n=1 Tax=Candidatus Syntropharchaeum butanivorans TaxID=1839936 RepID=A0A7C1B3K3_9EURY|nr:Asp-tRNA(Asn)/Glu-tRNA(Gln) amidotransferase subunit GatA [Candidatus Syntrophoarchaeum butanivorans]